MITFEEAQKVISESKFNISTEIVDIKDCLGRFLAEDIFSDINMPPFDKSAVDGFACRKSDISNNLEIIEIIQAGSVPVKIVGTNQCSQIMTGAPIPQGADTVIMVEDTLEIDNKFVRSKFDSVKQNICFLGEDIKENQLVLEKGISINPAHIAVMATVGYVNVKVAKKPKVSILSTGNEIIEPYLKPQKSQIRNSNSYQLIAQIKQSNAIPFYSGIVDDNEKSTYEAIKKAIEVSDIILITGGVSMGKFDFVPKILAEIGFDIKFHKISIQPGKPTLFAEYNGKFCFGLPGNPVSTFAIYELLVKPLIFKLQGSKLNNKNKRIKMQLGIDFNRKNDDRKSFLPVFINDKSEIIPVDYHGSAHINSLCLADGLAEIEIGIKFIHKGEFIDVRLF